MTQTVLNTIITFLVSGILGYCVNTIKSYKKRLKEKETNEKVQNTALQTLLQTQLTNTYFIYEKIGEIPDYIYKNWLNLFKIYKELGGNDYCDMLNHKMEHWRITKTDILDK